jgi:hypothetical protein
MEVILHGDFNSGVEKASHIVEFLPGATKSPPGLGATNLLLLLHHHHHLLRTF